MSSPHAHWWSDAGAGDWSFCSPSPFPWIYLTWLHPTWSDDPLDVTASILLAVCTVYAAVVLLHEVVKAEIVSRDIIAGAIAVYLLVGIGWAVAYALIEGLTPGAFNFGAAEQGTIWNKLLYFSFTTLTTLGFGDISPASPVARIWTVFEAVCGTFFLAILISRWSAYTSNRRAVITAASVLFDGSGCASSGTE